MINGSLIYIKTLFRERLEHFRLPGDAVWSKKNPNSGWVGRMGAICVISVIVSSFLLRNHHIWHQEFIKSKTSFGHNYVLFSWSSNCRARRVRIVDSGGVSWNLKHFWSILTHHTLCNQKLQRRPQVWAAGDTLCSFPMMLQGRYAVSSHSLCHFSLYIHWLSFHPSSTHLLPLPGSQDHPTIVSERPCPAGHNG